MIRITAVSAALILGLVAGNPFASPKYSDWMQGSYYASPEYSDWMPMSRSDVHYVTEELAIKYADYPQIGQILDGEKKQLDDGVKFLFLFNSIHSQRCCGLLVDADRGKYQYRCHPDIDQCRSDDVDNFTW